MIRGKIGSRRYWEIERRIAEKYGSAVWIKCPPRDEDECLEKKKEVKATTKSLEIMRLLNGLPKHVLLSWKKNKIIANRFDPLLANSTYRIAVDFRQPSRIEKKILDLFFWTWIKIESPLNNKNLSALVESVKEKINEKAHLFSEQAKHRTSQN